MAVMAEFFKSKTTWVVDFTYDGHPRRWFRFFSHGTDVGAETRATLQDLWGTRASLVAVREATPEEEAQYLRGEEAKNQYCPTGR
jgi:hypothetical protein